ncbi:hypothetical protein [Lewinella sp. IMCC34191]|uniref:hypothetical protein n=1 Tax=Lewinella sp. IMCC34191 TaxID=2259172 RepID=UPI000E2226E8|nr:hypothetical protein [Lewinella sp. IMCC34191]
MKLIYPLTFVAAILLILGGAYLKVELYGSAFWTDIMIGAGILLSFSVFAGILLGDEKELESA